jgi:mannose-6-phosphate isomerase-like protein (cupin superfamily)
MSELRFPDGQVLTIETTVPEFRFRAFLPPGLSGPPAHRHRFETETFTVEEGRLQVRVGRERRVLAAGQSVAVPPGVTHAFANPFDVPAVITTVESPAGPLHAQLTSLAGTGGRPSFLRMAAINAEHDWSFCVAGIPDGAQRMLWRALAAVARVRGIG